VADGDVDASVVEVVTARHPVGAVLVPGAVAAAERPPGAVAVPTAGTSLRVGRLDVVVVPGEDRLVVDARPSL
jgi:hypothetical protein